MSIKLSEMPEGTIVDVGDDERYEKLNVWRTLDESSDHYITLGAMDAIQEDVKIISVPYKVTLKLAEWLDNVYTMTGTPESLILEAAVDAKKTKHDAYISDRPKGGKG